MYGTALKQFLLHSVDKYSLQFPETPLLMAKFDLKTAYRRAHFPGLSALQSIATNRGLVTGEGGTCSSREDELAFVSLRFTFGLSANPRDEFSLLSKMISDLGNTVVAQHKDWDPPSKLHSEFISLTGPRPILQPDSIELRKQLGTDYQNGRCLSMELQRHTLTTVSRFSHFYRTSISNVAKTLPS
jgi:hypothetical protein